MARNAEDLSQWERMGWGEAFAFAEDLRELLKDEKWRKRSSRPTGRALAPGSGKEPEVVGDSLDLYSILERTKHGIHP